MVLLLNAICVFSLVQQGYSIAIPSTPTLPTSSLLAASPTPTVRTSYGSFRGTSAKGINSFLGVPHAQPPVASLRFALPQSPLPFSGIQNATAYGQICPQTPDSDGLIPILPNNLLSVIELTPALQPVNQNGGEDCLYANILAPVGAKNLPVLVYIHGGGWEFGGSNAQYDGTPIVTRSIANGDPIVYVIANYRLNGFGFMGGKEATEEGVLNLGLEDQLHFLNWIQKEIAAFGGDPTKVTIWGESVGAISVGLQTVMANTSAPPLFRGGWSNSGSPVAIGPIAGQDPQDKYDTVAALTGCTSQGLACLRNLSYPILKSAIDTIAGSFSYQAINSNWKPLLGGFIKGNPIELIQQGKYAKIPIVTGTLIDEGTLWALMSTNLTTDAESLDYFHSNYLPGATEEEIERLSVLYPSDPTVGCPYNTSYANQLTPQWKRIASVSGDLLFQSNRRSFLKAACQTQDCWSFTYERGHLTPFMGAFHTSDTTEEWFLRSEGGVDFEGIDYLLNFVNFLDPNGAPGSVLSPSLIQWNKYSVAKELLTFVDRPLGEGTLGLTITTDNFREEPINFWIEMWQKYNLW